MIFAQSALLIGVLAASAASTRCATLRRFDPRGTRVRDIERAFEPYGRMRVRALPRACLCFMCLGPTCTAGTTGPACGPAAIVLPASTPSLLHSCSSLQRSEKRGASCACRGRPTGPTDTPTAPPAPLRPLRPLCAPAAQRCEIKKTFAFVEFEDIEDAKEACKEVHGTRVNGREITGARAALRCAALRVVGWVGTAPCRPGSAAWRVVWCCAALRCALLWRSVLSTYNVACCLAHAALPCPAASLDSAVLPAGEGGRAALRAGAHWTSPKRCSRLASPILPLP